jgi:ABC-2 type transport system ATP-binding protein
MRGVTKTFGPKTAVADLDLTVPEGSIYGFIGPNGAGKTTTIRMVMSILYPDRGEIGVLGKASAVESKDRIGYLPEERGLYRKMRVGAFLSYMAKIKGADPHGLDRTIKRWLDRVGLLDCYRKRCEELSKGMQQKIQFLSTIIHEPDLVILDEPFSGLDPVNMRLLRDLIDEIHRDGKTVIFSTHVMHQAEQLCDHVVMIDRGLKVLDATMEQIRSRFDPRTIVIEPIDPGADLSVLMGVPGVRGVRGGEADGSVHEVLLDDGTDLPEAMRGIVELTPMRRIELRRPTLEDVFIQLVEETDDEAKRVLRASLRDEQGVPA